LGSESIALNDAIFESELQGRLPDPIKQTGGKWVILEGIFSTRCRVNDVAWPGIAIVLADEDHPGHAWSDGIIRIGVGVGSFFRTGRARGMGSVDVAAGHQFI
jgi:hypothetical protein